MSTFSAVMLVLATAATLDATCAHRDTDNGEVASYPGVRFSIRLKGAWAASKQLDQASSLHQAHALMRAGSPVKLTGTPLALELLKSWNLDSLVNAFGYSCSKSELTSERASHAQCT